MNDPETRRKNESWGMLKLRFLCLSVFSILTLFGVYISGPSFSERLIQHVGYYFIFVTFVVIYVLLKSRIRLNFRYFFLSKLGSRSALLGGLSIFAGAWVLYVHADFGPKIVMDEYILASTARNLHEKREVLVTERIVSYGEGTIAVDTFVDKRPWLYPFWVASVHDIFGYNDWHPYLVNAVIGLLFIFTVYLLGYGFAGPRGGAVLVLLWSTLPLLAQNICGGGMELLNVFLLHLVLLLCVFYLKKPSSRREGLLVLVGVLLTYSRYESALFFVPILMVVGLGWIRAKQVFLSWGSILAVPILFAGLLQLKLYSGNEASWELSNGAETAFSADYFFANIPNALNFFFSYDFEFANSLLLSVFGCVAFLVALMLGRTEWRRYYYERPLGVVFLIFAVFFALQLVVVVAFHAGQLDRLFVSRYALPFHGVLALSILIVIEFVARRYVAIWRISFSTIGIFIVLFTLPMNARAIFTERSFAVREQQWLERISGRAIRDDSIIIDRFTIPWALRGWVSIGPKLERPQLISLVNVVSEGRHPAIYFVERLHYDGVEFVSHTENANILHANLKLDLIDEQSFRPLQLTRVYQVVQILPVLE